MKIGLQLPHFRPANAATMRSWLIDTARTADQGGFDSLWFMDHFFQLGGWLGKPEEDMLEGYTALGFVAGVTERIKLGLLVGGVIYRQPALVVKSISTLDVLSAGRAYLGIGAAWYELESKSLGFPFPSLKERFEWLEEGLQIFHRMFDDADNSAYAGTHNQLDYPVNHPQPLTKPHPPILIGGMGPKKTLRMVAQYADACNFFAGAGMERLEESLGVLQEHCVVLGRDYDEIEKTVLATVENPQEGGIAAAGELATDLQALGFEHVIFNVNGLYSPETMQALVENLVPVVHALP
jgi:F420-dependent oxidoreductase-like protein